MISTESSSTASMDKSSILDKVIIAAPCNVGWENMEGTERVRFCAECKQNVYNTSLMSKLEIYDLLSDNGKMPCLRVYRRADGTLITEDCPVGLRKIRDGWRRMAKVAASVWAVAVSLMPAWAQNQLPDGIGRVEGPRETNGVGYDPGLTLTEWQSTHRADYHALYFHSKAKAALSKKKFEEADKFFQEAVAALDLSEHDPKFEELVFQDYAAFLKSQHKESQAEEILEQSRQRSIAKRDGHIFRMRKEQKVSPTLPEGAPIPANE